MLIIMTANRMQGQHYLNIYIFIFICECEQDKTVGLCKRCTKGFAPPIWVSFIPTALLHHGSYRALTHTVLFPRFSTEVRRATLTELARAHEEAI